MSARRCHADRPGVRPTGPCGPCGGGLRGLTGPPACASAGGSRALCAGGGCSAGRYACSRAVSVSEVVRSQGRGLSRLAPPTRGISSVDMRHRSTPFDRPTVRRATHQGQTEHAAGHVICPGASAACGQPLDPQPPGLLASPRPDFPTVTMHVPILQTARLVGGIGDAALTCMNSGRISTVAGSGIRPARASGQMHNLWTRVWTSHPPRSRPDHQPHVRHQDGVGTPAWKRPFRRLAAPT